MEETENDQKTCVICQKKIGWFRRWRTRKWDKDPMHLIPLSQFCSDICAAEGLIKIADCIEKGEAHGKLYTRN